MCLFTETYFWSVDSTAVSFGDAGSLAVIEDSAEGVVLLIQQAVSVFWWRRVNGNIAVHTYLRSCRDSQSHLSAEDDERHN